MANMLFEYSYSIYIIQMYSDREIINVFIEISTLRDVAVATISNVTRILFSCKKFLCRQRILLSHYIFAVCLVWPQFFFSNV